MDDLDFDAQWKYYKSIYGDNDSAFNEAVETHSLVVIDKLRDQLVSLHQLLVSLKNEKSQKNLGFGAMRRILTIVSSYNSIRTICHPKRKKPLTSEEQGELDRDINMIYINIRGVMDNLAWSFLFEKDLKLVSDLDLEKYKARVGLFSKDIRKASTLVFWKTINERFGAWAKEFSTKRDPVAHGLPMYVIPKFFESEGQQMDSLKLDEEAMTSLLNNEFDLSDTLKQRSQQLGIFAPYFAYDPTEKFMPIFPNVAIDISFLIRIVDHFKREVKS